MTDIKDAFSVINSSPENFERQRSEIAELMKTLSPERNYVIYRTCGFFDINIIHELQNKKYILNYTYSSSCGASVLKITNPAFIGVEFPGVADLFTNLTSFIKKTTDF